MSNLRNLALASLALAGCQGLAAAEPAAILGAPDAVARAERMLERVGGRTVWASMRTFRVEERAFLKNGETATVEAFRDFNALTRHMIVRSPSLNYVEVLGPEMGWEFRDGRLTRYDEASFSAQRQGLRQEPYYIYHRLANGDPALRVSLEGADKLNVHDASGALLCWFVLDARDQPISWGNHFKGALNQHWYGPLERFGPVMLPRWGSASDGRWRFEYVDAAVSEQPLELPPPPG